MLDKIHETARAQNEDKFMIHPRTGTFSCISAYLFRLHSFFPGREHQPTLSRLSGDMILHIINNAGDVLPVWEGHVIALDERGGHESDLEECKVLANALSVTCNTFPH